MDPTILAAIIGGICTLLAPIITLHVNNILKNKKLHIASRDMRKALEGEWVGTGLQKSGLKGEKREYRVKMIFKTYKRRIKGSVISSSKIDIDDIELLGEYINDSYIKLNYYNKDKRIMQFGVAILRLSSDSKRLEGLSIGYGQLTEGIISGEIILEKAI